MKQWCCYLSLLLFQIVYCYDVNLSQMMQDIESDPIEIKKHYTGPLIHPHYQKKDNKLNINFKCSALYNAQLKNSQGVWPPPKEIPNELLSAYTFDNTIPVHSWYWSEKQNGGSGYFWSDKDIQTLGNAINVCGGYNLPHCAVAIEKYKHFIEGKTGMVFGSQWPWAESALLIEGKAKHITTIEYMAINTTHPRLSAMIPYNLATQYLKGSFEPVDFAFSYSSFEHDGLGRYGDPLNPYGDLEAIARVHCLLKPGGIFFLGLPIGPDVVVWNAHRIYGKHRLSIILANWDPIDLTIGANFRVTNMTHIGFSLNQPVWVLRKKELVVGRSKSVSTP